MENDFNEILNNLVSYPRKSQIQIDFDLEKRLFILSVPIHGCKKSITSSVKKYVESRKEIKFKPHATFFKLEEDKQVLLIQEIPFQYEMGEGSKKDILYFYQLAKKCHQMLNEIALEEHRKAALDLMQDV